MAKEKKSIRNITSIFILSLLFAVIQLFGGLITNSVAILTDSIRNFGDAISIGIALTLEKKTRKRPDKKFTYGYYRFSVVGSFVSTIFMVIGSLFALSIIIPRLINPVHVNDNGMFILAVFGLVINGMNRYTDPRTKNLNEQAANLHQMEDIFSWVAVLITSTVINIYDLPILDSILSIIIILVGSRHTFRHLKTIFDIILEKVPDDMNIKQIESEILKNDKIKDIKYFHIWSLDGIRDYASLTIVIDSKLSLKQVLTLKDHVKNLIKEQGITYSTIEIEMDSLA